MTEHGSGNEYTYDAANQRLRKTESGDSTYYVTNGLEVLAEYDENDNLQAEHIYGLGRMLAKFEPGTGHTFFYTDHLGSTRLVGSSSESADDMRRDYYPYGEALTAAGNDDTPYTFTGKELDSSTDLHYFGARYYDARIGRWLVPDALADRYLAWSPYNYGLANPVNLVDRDGDAVFLPIIAVAVAGALIADLIDPSPANAPGPSDPVFQGKSDAEFAVGEGIGAALGIGLAKAAGKIAGKFLDDAAEFVDVTSLRFSQRTAGGRGRAEQLRKSMSEKGYSGDPIDVVRTDKGLVAIDNTRPAVAGELGMTEIPARVHLPHEPLPENMLGRFGDAKTWGEALIHRTSTQRPPLPATGTRAKPKMPDTKLGEGK